MGKETFSGLFGLWLFSLALLPFLAAAEARVTFMTRTAVVTDVEDGDTFHLTFPGHPVEYRANLIGVDAAGWEEEGGDCYAKEAADFLRLLILSREVTIRWDSHDKVDRRGRLLVYVEVDGKDVNAEILRGGYGWVPRPFAVDRKEEYLRLERRAREEKKGLWGACPESYLRYRPQD